MNDNRVFLAVVGLATAGSIYLTHKLIDIYMDYKVKKLKSELQVDTLNINKLLTFGLGDACPNRRDETHCDNLDCNHGRLNYLLNFINSCKERLDVCIYIITAEVIGSAILRAHQRGVVVRVIADADMAISSQSYINTLWRYHIPIRHRSSFFIMHHKFMIVDGKLLINGSMNYTMTGIFGNLESVLVTSQTALVSQFQAHFDALWTEFKV